VFRFTGGIAALVCLDDITTSNDVGQCSAVVSYTATPPDGATIACVPPSDSVFPVGATTVNCTATYTDGRTAACAFTVNVEDREAPQALCRPATNPSGGKIPVAGKTPVGSNPDGFFQVLSKDNCDVNPGIYIGDSASSFVAGPFQNGDIVKIVQAPDSIPSQSPGSGVVVARIHVRGEAQILAVDAAGNASVPISCTTTPTH